MAEEFVPFGSPAYFALLACLIGARAMDFISTWIATPNLVLEANPLAKKMGWRIALIVNTVICFTMAIWPLPSVMLITMSLLVAAHNFHSAWLMRTMGEHEYRFWMSERLSQAPRSLFLFCLLGETSLVGILGSGLAYFTGELVPYGIGMGMVTYALAVLGFSLYSVWRLRAKII